jgi:hypothetical protein
MSNYYAYTIENYRYEAHDLDDEVVYIRFDIHFTAPETTVIDSSYPFDKFLRYLEKTQPAFATYLKKVRQGLDKWGPMEKTLLDSVGEEAIAQVYGYLELYLKETNHAPAAFEHYKKRWADNQKNAAKNNEELVELLAEMDETAKGVKEYQQRYRRFCELAQRHMRDVALEMYPEIADLEPEKLKAFKNVFVHEIIKMHERIEQLLKE